MAVAGFPVAAGADGESPWRAESLRRPLRVLAETWNVLNFSGIDAPAGGVPP